MRQRLISTRSYGFECFLDFGYTRFRGSQELTHILSVADVNVPAHFEAAWSNRGMETAARFLSNSLFAHMGSHLIASSARFATFSFPFYFLRKTSVAARLSVFSTGLRLGKNGL